MGNDFIPPQGLLVPANSLPSGIDASKIANGSVSNTEFQYIDGLTSNAQTQITNKTLNLTNQEVILTGSNFTTTSASFVDVTGMTVTLPNRAGGKAQVNGFFALSNSTAALVGGVFVDNAVQGNSFQITSSVGGSLSASKNRVTTLSGQIVKMQVKTGGGTLSVLGTTNGNPTVITTLEISQP